MAAVNSTGLPDEVGGGQARSLLLPVPAAQCPLFRRCIASQKLAVSQQRGAWASRACPSSSPLGSDTRP